jgi:hypothetical protein
MALFKDSETDARAVTWIWSGSSSLGVNGSTTLCLDYSFVAGSTSSIAIKIRGGATGQTLYYNSGNGGGRAGGSFVIMEIAA